MSTEMEHNKVCIYVGVLVGLPFLYVAVKALWNVFFHPLRGTPGPKLWIAFPVLRHFESIRGRLDISMTRFHGRYGDVVRFSPDEVSFITPQAWKDIYGHGHRQLQKFAFTSDMKTPDIISSNDSDHSRYRKALSHGFSMKGLGEQEPLLKGYIDRLIERLRKEALVDTPADMVKWYNLTTFDMIGDLAFGESFGGLQNQHLHFWVSAISNSIKVLSFIRAAADYPLLFKTVSFFLPKSLREARDRQIKYVEHTVKKRLGNDQLHGRGDFIDSMNRHREEKNGLTDNEIVANASILVIAGSETTATLLSGVTYWLLRTPHAYQRVVQEVRSAFQSEADITFRNATARLPYMLACLDEAFRIYPPVPTGLQRVTPAGELTIISGHEVTPGVGP